MVNQDKQQRFPKGRMRALTFLVGLLASLIIVRLAYVQIVHGSQYKQDADKQYTTPKNDIFERGTIYFKKKTGDLISAASQVTGYKVSVTPAEIKNPEAVYTALAPILQIDHDTFIQKATKVGDPYEEIATKLTREQADAIDALKFDGVKIYKDKWRVYPGDALASHAIGFVAYQGDVLKGRYGLERYYNNTLSRAQNGAYVNFFAEVFSNISDVVFESGQEEGDLVTTIEPSVEQQLEETLGDVQKKWSAEFAAGIVMNPKTGEIYAISKTPSFDLNNFGKVTDPVVFSNPFVENVFEFGSVMKPLVMAAGIDVGAVTPTTTYFDKGYVEVKDRKFNNFDKKGRGTASMQDVLNQSLNTGMVFVEQKMGKPAFKKYMLAYQLGERTGIDLPNETSGLIGNLYSGGDVEYATAAFGQGIAVTPVEAVRAFSALANGGKMVTPHLVSRIEYENGTAKKIDPVLSDQVISPDSAATIATMMTHVVDDALGGGIHKMEHYAIAAKTGTAQIAKESGGGYYEGRYLHSFFGFFPATNPKFLILLFLKDPKGVDYASQTLTDPFFSLAQFLLHYYNVSPDR